MMKQSSVVLTALLMIFTGCEKTLDIKGESSSKETACQVCHESPPPTGAHSFHVFQQSYREQITCQECHSTVIEEMKYNYSSTKEVYRLVSDLDSIHVESDQAGLFIFNQTTEEYPACITQVFNDSVFQATLGLQKEPVAGFDGRDSLVETDDIILRFPFVMQIDSVDSNLFILPWGLVIDTLKVNVWQPPLSYNACNHFIEQDTLFTSTESDPRGLLITTLGGRSTHNVDNDENLLTLNLVDSTLDTSFSWQMVPVNETILDQVPREEWKAFTTVTLDDEYVLVNGQDELFQWVEDSIYKVALDSFMNYENDILAFLSSDHGNGEINIGFLHEETSLYLPETTLVTQDGGEIENLITFTGAWRPERKSCMSGGLQGGGCHTGLNKRETFWEENPNHEVRLKLGN